MPDNYCVVNYEKENLVSPHLQKKIFPVEMISINERFK